MSILVQLTFVMRFHAPVHQLYHHSNETGGEQNTGMIVGSCGYHAWIGYKPSDVGSGRGAAPTFILLSSTISLPSSESIMTVTIKPTPMDSYAVNVRCVQVIRVCRIVPSLLVNVRLTSGE